MPLGDADKSIGMRIIESNIKNRAGEVAYYSYYAYWFAGKDRDTPSHYMRMFWLAWDRVFRSKAHKWAYIAVSGERDDGSLEYEDTVKEFVAMLYPALQIESEEG